MKKLVLKKEVVAAMNDNQLSHLKGGGCGCGCGDATPPPMTEVGCDGIGSGVPGGCCTWEPTGCMIRASMEQMWGDICAPTSEPSEDPYTDIRCRMTATVLGC